MAFDLKRVLKVLLFASNGPLSVKDIQTAISRFHETASVGLLADGQATGGGEAAAPAPTEPEEPVLPAPVEDDEFYRDVPALVTTAMIRESIDAISLELQAADSEILLVEVDSSFFAEEYFAPRPRSEIMRNLVLDLQGMNLMRPWREALREYLAQDLRELGGGVKRTIDLTGIEDRDASPIASA